MPSSASSPMADTSQWRQMAQPATAIAMPVKIRDSCHACAISKVRCSKERPVCARCIKRGTSCRYLITKRPGRKQEPRPTSSPAASVNVAEAALDSSTTVDDPHHHRSGPAIDSDALMSSHPLDLSTFDSSFNDLLNFAPPTPFFHDQGVDENVASPFAFVENAALDVDNIDWSAITGFSNDGRPTESRQPRDISSRSSLSSKSSSAFTTHSEDTIFLFGANTANRGSRTAPRSASMVAITYTGDERQHPQRGCRCIMQALELLKLLCSSSSGINRELNPNAEGHERQIRMAKTLIARNSSALESLSDILQCWCTPDSFLLTIMTHILSKTLECYARAAMMTSTPHTPVHSMTPSLDMSEFMAPLWTDDHTERRLSYHDLPLVRTMSRDQARRETQKQAAELVLGELHKLQRVMSRIAPHLVADIAAGDSGYNSMDACVRGETDHLAHVLPLCKSLSQFEPEMRRRMRSLSMSIITFLRQE